MVLLVSRMAGKEDILIFFLLIWVGVIIPFDPNKRNVIYNGSKKARIFCCVSALIGMITMVLYEINFNSQALGKSVENISQCASGILIICSILCYRELLLRKNKGIVFKIISILSVILIMMGALWLIFYWVGILEFDIYLLFAPSLGSIMLSAHGSTYNAEKESLM